MRHFILSILAAATLFASHSAATAACTQARIAPGELTFTVGSPGCSDTKKERAHMAQALKLALESLPASRGGPVVYQTPNEQKLKRISEMKAQAKHLSATKGPAYYGQRK